MKIGLLAVILVVSLASPLYAQQTGVVAEVFRIVNIRSGPSTADAAIGQLIPGDRAEVLARSNEDTDWLLIQHNGVRGWVAYFVVSVVGDASQLPIVADEQTDLVEPPVELAPASAAATNVTSTLVTATTFRRANIRTRPDLNSPILMVVQRGEVLVVLARNNGENEWLLVETPSGDGWIAYFLVTLDGNLSELPILNSEEVAETTDDTAELEAVAIQLRFNANLRAQPNIGAQILSIVPFDATVQATGRSENGEWIRVTYQGEEGWILTSLAASFEEIEQLRVTE